MTYLSVCSGIEAASVAWGPLGWSPWAFAEVDRFPSAVLAHHYPDVPNLGDMTTFKDWPDATIDVLVGGTPCQSFSVAGLRAGLDDPRGGLLLTYLAIARRYRPRWVVWENVPGVLSADDGRAFGSLLGGLAEFGYGFAYRILDAQHFGLAQRRKRVFVVGHLGDWRRAAAVLFERASLSGHPAPSREAWQIAPTVPSRRTGGGGLGTDFDCDGGLIAYGGNNTSGPIDVATACNAHGGSGRIDFESETFITHALRADGFDASEDGTGRGTPLVPVVFDVAGTLTGGASAGGHGRFYSVDAASQGFLIPENTALAFDARQSDVIQYGDKSGPLDTDGHTIGVLAFDTYNQSLSDVTQTLRDPNGTFGDAVPAVTQGMAVRRLTPRECERLQGFPDDYTLIPYRGKPASDGPRYKALGNSMAVPVMRWIGERIAQVERLDALRDTA